MTQDPLRDNREKLFPVRFRRESVVGLLEKFELQTVAERNAGKRFEKLLAIVVLRLQISGEDPEKLHAGVERSAVGILEECLDLRTLQVR